MKLELDSDYLNELQITPNQYTYAFLIHNGDLDSILRFVQIEGEARVKDDLFKLYQKGFLSEDYGQIESMFTIDLKNLKVLKLFKKDKYTEAEFETFFSLWMDLFPKGVRSGGVLVRSDETGCRKKMKKFLKEYPKYNFETIVNATRRYIDRFKLKNYEYMNAAIYFIEKQGRGSNLATECEEYLNSINNTVSNSTSYGSKRG